MWPRISNSLVPKLLLISITPMIMHGAEVSWTGGTGDWSLDSNWSSGSLPEPEDIVTLSNGGTIMMDVDTEIAGFNLSSGKLSGASTLTVAGSFDWTGGSLDGGGELILGNESVTTIRGDSSKDLRNRRVNHEGQATLSGAGSFRGGFGGEWNNQEGSKFEITNNADVLIQSLGGSAGGV